MSTGIRARFLLGTYTGHQANGKADALPSPGRLHAALLNAAGQGSTAVPTTNGLAPSEEAIAALEWLEQNPPTGIRIPRMLPLTDGSLKAFSKEGRLTKEASVWKDKVSARTIADGTALDGDVGWCWDHPVPETVLATLDALCADVSCLGETTSPVALEVAEIESTHILDPDATPFDTGGIQLDTPSEGRTRTLREAHRQSTSRIPSVTDDKHTQADLTVTQPIPRSSMQTQRYRQPDQVPTNAPWPRAFLIPATPSWGGEIPPPQRVGWCVTMHRALISVIGFGASPLLTGRYPDGASVPANRVAIQYLSPSLAKQHHRLDSAAFVLMLPAGSALELESLPSDLSWLTRLTRGNRSVALGEPIPVSGEEFWSAPRPDMVRLWRSDTVIVPETAPQRRGRGPNGARQAWTLADAARLSTALVWRDQFPTPVGNRRFEQLADLAADHHVQVFDTQRIHGSDVSCWVHRTPSQIVVQPFRATLSLGDLATSRMLVALGQSRHLGAGLLTPRDVSYQTLLDVVDKDRT